MLESLGDRIVPKAAPVASNVSASIHSGQSVVIAPSYTDADNDVIAVDSTSTPSHGGVSVTAEGVTYTPAAGFSGTDSFTYTITDSNGGYDTATITVTVWNTAPVGEDLDVTTRKLTTLSSPVGRQ